MRTAVALVLALAGFAGVVTRAAAQTMPDLKVAREAIMKADEDFNQSVADRNREKFLSLIANEVTFGGGTGNELKSKEAIWSAWSVFFDPKGPTLTWHPNHAAVLAGGDVGYTIGFSERRAPNGTVNKGNYLTVWKKQKDGSWKAIFDTGTGVPEP